VELDHAWPPPLGLRFPFSASISGERLGTKEQSALTLTIGAFDKNGAGVQTFWTGIKCGTAGLGMHAH